MPLLFLALTHEKLRFVEPIVIEFTMFKKERLTISSAILRSGDPEHGSRIFVDAYYSWNRGSNKNPICASFITENEIGGFFLVHHWDGRPLKRLLNMSRYASIDKLT